MKKKIYNHLLNFTGIIYKLNPPTLFVRCIKICAKQVPMNIFGQSLEVTVDLLYI